MVHVAANAFTIANGSPRNRSAIPISVGMDVTRIGRRPVLIFGEKHVQLGTRAVDMPTLSPDGTRLVRARREKGEVGGVPTLVYALPNFTGILVRIEANGLDFGFRPYVTGLNLWAGGDGHIRPILSSDGKIARAHRAQLFQLRELQSIFVVDCKGAIVKLTCLNGVPTFACVDLSTMVDFHVLRARAQAKVTALDWALHNLQALSRGGYSLPIVKNAISELEGIRAQFL